MKTETTKTQLGFGVAFFFGQKHLIHNTSLTDQRSKKREKNKDNLAGVKENSYLFSIILKYSNIFNW